MPEQPLTAESVLELIRDSIRESGREFDRKMAESRAEYERYSRETNKKISALGSRIDEIVENMVAGGIVDKFRALDYAVTQCSSNLKFWHPSSKAVRGEIDLFLENGDSAILIEVKTTLEIADVRKHIERLEAFRDCANAKGDKRHFIGAVAGAVVKRDAKVFAHENGMYVITQSGEAIEILPLPEEFKVKKW
jgi:hypothetical protein